MDKITVKKVLTHQNKYVYIPVLTGIFLVFYTVCGAISYQNASLLPMLALEESIPLMPWTIWIYIVLYPIYLFSAIFSFKTEAQMNRNLYSFVLLMLLSCACFLIFPVTYPRDYYPLPLDNELTTMIFRGVRKLDKPSNCLPSLHVGLCYLFALGFYHENKRKFKVSLFLSTIIAISTLTTKQHYIYDIIAGFLLSFIIFLFFSLKVKIKDC